MVVVCNSVGSRLDRVPIGKHDIGDELSTVARFPTCKPNFPSFLRLWTGYTVSDSSSSKAIWYTCSLHSSLLSLRPQYQVVPLRSGGNIASSILLYFLESVALLDVCPASGEHTLSLWGYELLSLSSTVFVGERRSWQWIGWFCVRWLPRYCRHVRLRAIADTNRSHRSWQMSVIYVLGSRSQSAISNVGSDKPLVLEPATRSISDHIYPTQPTMQPTIIAWQRTNPRAKQCESQTLWKCSSLFSACSLSFTL